jgi:indole-3-glycerol phosphate synthase
MGMTILEKIVEKKKERVASLKKEKPFYSLERQFAPVKPFLQKGRASLIAECKKGSPSKGVISEMYKPVATALHYERGGASALSVLTEEDFFYGSTADFTAVRNSVSLPMIRKDFIFDEYQIKESWAIGADAILFIVASLSDSQMKELYEKAKSYNLSVLVEAHDENEIERALLLENAIIGINARNLKDFSVDIERIAAMRSLIPAERIAVAESGITSIEAAKLLRSRGFDAFLVGEYFMRSDNPESRVKSFVSAIEAAE